MNLSQDDILWNSFRDGDHRSFELIYKQHAARLLEYGCKLSGNRLLAEDTLQELFIELWHSRQNLGSTDNIRAYLFKAIRYKLMRASSRRPLYEQIEESDHKFSIVSSEDVIITLELQSEQMRHLRETLANLPERQREAVMLRYYHNFSNEEIAEIMGINYHSACKNLYFAIQKLKENLKMAVVSVSALLVSTPFIFF